MNGVQWHTHDITHVLWNDMILMNSMAQVNTHLIIHNVRMDSKMPIADDIWPILHGRWGQQHTSHM